MRNKKLSKGKKISFFLKFIVKKNSGHRGKLRNVQSGSRVKYSELCIQYFSKV